jgi:hypothetical protein
MCPVNCLLCSFEFEFDHRESKVKRRIDKSHPQRIILSFVDLNEPTRLSNLINFD